MSTIVNVKEFYHDFEMRNFKTSDFMLFLEIIEDECQNGELVEVTNDRSFFRICMESCLIFDKKERMKKLIENKLAHNIRFHVVQYSSDKNFYIRFCAKDLNMLNGRRWVSYPDLPIIFSKGLFRFVLPFYFFEKANSAEHTQLTK